MKKIFLFFRKFSRLDFDTAIPVSFAFATKVALILSWVAYLHSISAWFVIQIDPLGWGKGRFVWKSREWVAKTAVQGKLGIIKE